MFPEINTNKDNPTILSSQSTDKLRDGLSKTRSKKSRKRLSSENSFSSGKVKRLSSCESFADESNREVSNSSKKTIKTSKVKINEKVLRRQITACPNKPSNPFKEVVTKNMLEEGSPEAMDDIKKFWLYSVALLSRTSFFSCLTNNPCAYTTPTVIKAAQLRWASNVRLVLYIKQRCRWFRSNIKAKTDFVRNHGWKLLLFWRCIQRRKAVVLLRRMLHDFECFRLPYVMLRYRVNAVHLQRYVRSFLEVTESRKRVLLLKWRKVAAHMKANLIPFLFDQKEKEDEIRRRQAQEKWQGVEINKDVLPTIAPRVNLITKRTAALQNQINKSEETIQKHRKEMFDKRKKKSTKNIKLPPMHNSRNSVKRHERRHHNRCGLEGDDDKLISSIISKFVYECRRTCKILEQHKFIVREKKRQDGMTCEEARRIITNPYAAKMFAEELSNTEVKLERIKLFIFTGDQDYAFRLLVENHLRAENQFELTDHCTEYDIYNPRK